MEKVSNKSNKIKGSKARKERKQQKQKKQQSRRRYIRRRKNCIGSVESCEREVSSRSGLCCYMEYLDREGIPVFISNFLGHLRKSSKGIPVTALVLQLLAFFVDGTNTALSFFDTLKKEPSRFSLLGIDPQQGASSHSVKRFLDKFALREMRFFERIHLELFVWRLRVEQPKTIELCLDSVVYDNDDALKRQSCSPTYKKVKGFQPLNVLWNGYTVWSRFRRGSAHGNKGDGAKTAIKQVTLRARSALPDVQIIWRFDSGFFDQRLFDLCNELDTICIFTGKMYNDVKEAAQSVAEEDWQILQKHKVSWKYASIIYVPKKWKKNWKKDWKEAIPHVTTVYTSLVSDESGQGILSFERPSQVILSNYNPNNPKHRSCISGIEDIVRLNQSRGADELVHRATKEIAGEKFPSKGFFSNAAYYHFMILAHNTLLAFQRDVVTPVLPELTTATPQRLRRRIIDVAGRVVRTARTVILKVFAPRNRTAELQIIWEYLRKKEPTFLV